MPFSSVSNHHSNPNEAAGIKFWIVYSFSPQLKRNYLEMVILSQECSTFTRSHFKTTYDLSVPVQIIKTQKCCRVGEQRVRKQLQTNARDASAIWCKVGQAFWSLRGKGLDWNQSILTDSLRTTNPSSSFLKAADQKNCDTPSLNASRATEELKEICTQ